MQICLKQVPRTVLKFFSEHALSIVSKFRWAITSVFGLLRPLKVAIISMHQPRIMWMHLTKKRLMAMMTHDWMHRLAGMESHGSTILLSLQHGPKLPAI